MSEKQELFTDLTSEEGANISGGQGTINYTPPPPKKPKPPKVDVDKDCGCVFPAGENIGLFGTTKTLDGGAGVVGGVAIRF